jgi:adenylate kinase
VILFQGAAGAGKSMQGKMLADQLGLAWLSTGEFLRMLVVGKRRHEMLSGVLLNDTEMILMVDKIFRIIDIRDEFVLDGFPRTQTQAEWLLAQAKAGLVKITALINMEADEDTIVERLGKRGRQDDTPEVIKQRISDHKKLTIPIIDLFEKQNVPILNIDANGDIKEIHSIIIEQVSRLLK